MKSKIERMTLRFLSGVTLFGFIAANVTNPCSGVKCFLPMDYNKRMRPLEESGKPLEIELNLYIESFGDVDVAKMQFDAFGYLSQEWTDERLVNVSNTPLILEREDADYIWLPDIYCTNCRKTNLENGKNPKQGMVRIDKGGSVYFSFLAVVVASCSMDLHKFPFDTQHCTLELASYAYNTSRLTYRWKKAPQVKITNMDQFHVSESKATNRTEEYMLGTFAIVSAGFTFERRVGFYILQLYIPTAMLVCLSWAMFCLNHAHAGERITIGVTLFLTMIFLNGYANTSLPKVSYVKSIDIFMVVSLTEILLIIFESIIVTKLFVTQECKRIRKDIRRRTMSKRKLSSVTNEEKKAALTVLENKEDMKPKTEGIDDHEPNWISSLMRAMENPRSLITRTKLEQIESETGDVYCVKRKAACKCQMSDVIEKISAFLIPASYIAFNTWYWIAYKPEHVSEK
eukprot:Seg2549.3 transcript_id=Seg2549.3/GoldUCD/mRNA.D3Y31 product="Gamma-aminobutyric acid receptor subunit beta-3" protein_id=Seg2549.3/GoldUCD/D3Y31